MFDDLLFDTNGGYPFCEKLDEILSEFQLSGIIGSKNPILKEYSIDIGGIEEKEVYDYVSPKDVPNIKKLADLFVSNLGVSSAS